MASPNRTHNETVEASRKFFKNLDEKQRVLLSKPWWHPLTIQRRYNNFVLHVFTALEKFVRTVWFTTGGRWLFLKRLRKPYSEPYTIKFVRKHTTIPVPTVFGVVPWRGDRWMVMSRVRGRPLYPWLWETMENDRRNQIIGQLRDMVSQMRAIPPPPSPQICSVLGGPVYDVRLCTTEPLLYKDEEEMNTQLRDGAPLDRAHLRIKNHSPTFPSDLLKSHSIRHRLVFTHGDIALRNIMVEGSEVTAFIDWETSGWYPEHWEYLKACFGALGEASIIDRLPGFIPPYEFEARVDIAFGWGLPRERRI